MPEGVLFIDWILYRVKVVCLKNWLSVVLIDLVSRCKLGVIFFAMEINQKIKPFGWSEFCIANTFMEE
jgi:hypothetical protein